MSVVEVTFERRIKQISHHIPSNQLVAIYTRGPFNYIFVMSFLHFSTCHKIKFSFFSWNEENTIIHIYLLFRYCYLLFNRYCWIIEKKIGVGSSSVYLIQFHLFQKFPPLKPLSINQSSWFIFPISLLSTQKFLTNGNVPSFKLKIYSLFKNLLFPTDNW